MIELHASFLESNLQSQVRALPNPDFSSDTAHKAAPKQPLTIHLSPTTIANVAVTSLSPSVPSTIAFAKLLPNAEVVVVPKPRLGQYPATEATEAANSMIGSRASRPELKAKAVLKRVASFQGYDERCTPNPEHRNHALSSGLSLLIGADALLMEGLLGCKWVVVSTCAKTPPGLQDSRKIHGNAFGTRAGVVAALKIWPGAPDARHAILSPLLCAGLQASGMMGEIINVERAPPPLARASIKRLGIHPFRVSSPQNLQLRGPPDANEGVRSIVLSMIRAACVRDSQGVSSMLFSNNLILSLPDIPDSDSSNWLGGVLSIDAVLSASKERQELEWILDEDCSMPIEVLSQVPCPHGLFRATFRQINPDLKASQPLAGVETMQKQAIDWLIHGSSVLINGMSGSGKTSLALSIERQLRQPHNCTTSFTDCRQITASEPGIPNMKATLDHIFLAAARTTAFGSFSIVILDNLEKLCGTEKDDPGSQEHLRSRQLAELFNQIVQRYCSTNANIRMLATAPSKSDVHSIIVGGIVFFESLALGPPEKSQRQDILNILARRAASDSPSVHDHSAQIEARKSPLQADGPDSRISRIDSQDLYDGSLDTAEIANRTEGFMPADLALLLERAKGERLARRVHSAISTAPVTNADVWSALKSFTPALLKSTNLSSSMVRLDSVGGLEEPRATLLETLLYPSSYSPIFRQCPLRLRSGILLYGFPGCGKTLLASAIAHKCGLNFISIKGPEVLNKYIGASEKSVRDLFERAQAAKPCILFFDEFDSLVPKRGHDSTGVTDRVVNQLLTQLDGAEELSGVYVLAATSRPDLIDPALLRPGRLDKSLLCDLPSTLERHDILRTICKGLDFESTDHTNPDVPDLVFQTISQRTNGFTGADLQAVIYNAHLDAIQERLEETLPSQPSADVDSSLAATRIESNVAKQKRILEFRFGEYRLGHATQTPPSDCKVHASSTTLPSNVTTRAGVPAKLRQLGMTMKSSHHRNVHTPRMSVEAKVKTQDGTHVTIKWRHLETALSSTHCSISGNERARLRRIYNEFSKMRGADGTTTSSTSVGTRSSLM